MPQHRNSRRKYNQACYSPCAPEYVLLNTHPAENSMLNEESSTENLFYYPTIRMKTQLHYRFKIHFSLTMVMV